MRLRIRAGRISSLLREGVWVEARVVDLLPVSSLRIAARRHTSMWRPRRPSSMGARLQFLNSGNAPTAITALGPRGSFAYKGGRRGTSPIVSPRETCRWRTSLFYRIPPRLPEAPRYPTRPVIYGAAKIGQVRIISPSSSTASALPPWPLLRPARTATLPSFRCTKKKKPPPK